MDNEPLHGAAQLPPRSAPSLPTYPGRWQGHLLLVCRKCRKKLRRTSADDELLKLKKALKRRARHDDHGGLRLHMIEVPCLKMCPKGGITTCTQGQLSSGECSVLRSAADVDALYMQCKAEASLTR